MRREFVAVLHKPTTIRFIPENVLAAMATGHDMADRPDVFHSEFTRHSPTRSNYPFVAIVRADTWTFDKVEVAMVGVVSSDR